MSNLNRDTPSEDMLIYNIDITNLLKIKNIKYNDYENAAVLSFKRKERFIEGYNCHTELIIILNKFFGSRPHLECEDGGLIKAYKDLKKYVVEKNLIGHILAGMNMKNTLINNYTTITFDKIELTIPSICRYLIKEYFTQDEVINMCKQYSNFNLYYT